MVKIGSIFSTDIGCLFHGTLFHQNAKMVTKSFSFWGTRSPAMSLPSANHGDRLAPMVVVTDYLRRTHSARHADRRTDVGRDGHRDGTLSRLSMRELISKLSSSSPNGFSSSSATCAVITRELTVLVACSRAVASTAAQRWKPAIVQRISYSKSLNLASCG